MVVGGGDWMSDGGCWSSTGGGGSDGDGGGWNCTGGGGSDGDGGRGEWDDAGRGRDNCRGGVESKGLSAVTSIGGSALGMARFCRHWLSCTSIASAFGAPRLFADVATGRMFEEDSAPEIIACYSGA